MMEEIIDGWSTARVADEEHAALMAAVRRAVTLTSLARLEEDAGITLDAVEADPLAADDAVMHARRMHAQAVATIARRREGL
jgi:hypothetical protein